jgi:Peptidase A4 family
VRRPLAFAACIAAVAAGPATAAPAHHAYLANAARAASSTSANWSGYIVSGASFSDVKGTWVEPTVTCTGGTSASAFWVGLGGSAPGSQGLEQIGSSADCQSGRPTYYAWYEILPAASVTIPLKVSPGDTVTAEVNANGTTFTFTIADVASGSTFSQTATVARPAVDSAEWIAEAPSMCARSCQILPLANFGTASFSAASATTADGHSGAISDTGWTNDAIQLGSRSVIQALPSTLSGDGASFSVAWMTSGVTVVPTQTRKRKSRPHHRGH